MTIDAITQASLGLDQEYIPMVVSYINFLKTYKNNSDILNEIPVQNKKKPKDAINVFKGSLLYMAEDFNETPEEFKEYM